MLWRTVSYLLLLNTSYSSIRHLQPVQFSKMGAGQSMTAANAREQRVLDQLRAMRSDQEIRQSEIEKEYIHVDSEKGLPHSYSVDPSISVSQAGEWEKTLLSDPKNRLALSALLGNDVDAVVSQKTQTLADTQTFNVKIPFEGAPITNQRSSGRCWYVSSLHSYSSDNLQALRNNQCTPSSYHEEAQSQIIRTLPIVPLLLG